MKVSFLPAASAELKEAVDFYNLQRPGLGDDFKDEVRASVARIQFWPRAWSRVSRRARRCRTRRFPYLVVYVELSDQIVIVAVMHSHRRPGYWRKRLRDIDP
jgi:plasmid stabilization system protein ParE